MNPPDETRDEEQFASLLGATDTDAPPPDQALLGRLRAIDRGVRSRVVPRPCNPEQETSDDSPHD